MECLWSGQGKIRRHNLGLAAVIVKDKVRFRRTIHHGPLLRRKDAGCHAAKQQSAKYLFLHKLSPYCVTFKVTSSSTNEVCSVESSTPLKKI